MHKFYIYIYIKNNKTQEATKKYDEDKKIHRIYFNCMPIHTFLTYFNSIQVLVVEQTNTNRKTYTSSFSRFHFNTHKKIYGKLRGFKFWINQFKGEQKRK